MHVKESSLKSYLHLLFDLNIVIVGGDIKLKIYAPKSDCLSKKILYTSSVPIIKLSKQATRIASVLKITKDKKGIPRTMEHQKVITSGEENAVPVFLNLILILKVVFH